MAYNKVVNAMAKFTEQERAEIFRRSCELLEDKPPEPPPAPEPPLVLEEIDPVRKWREEADAHDRERQANRAAMQRQQRDAARANWSAWDAYVDARIAAALAQRQHELTELASSTVAFANAVDKKLQEFDRLLNELKAALKQERQHAAREPLDMPSPLVRRERLIN